MELKNQEHSDEQLGAQEASASQAPASGKGTAPKGKRPKLLYVVSAIAVVLLLVSVGLSTNLFGCDPADEEPVAVEQTEVADQDAEAQEQSASSKKSSEKKESASTSGASSSSAQEQAASNASGSSGGNSSAKASSSSSASGKASSSKKSSSTSGKNESSQKPVKSDTITVSILVDASAASSAGYASTFANTTVELSQGSTVYDALVATGLAVSSSNSSGVLYVTSINGLAEKQLSSGSGWTYYVNGTFPMKSSAAYKLSDGDAVSWVYVV